MLAGSDRNRRAGNSRHGARGRGGSISRRRRGAAAALASARRRLDLPRPVPEPVRSAAARWRAAVFASGFALLALEVVWFRFLALFVVTHAEAFAWMLATVLAGISRAAWAGGWAYVRRRPGHIVTPPRWPSLLRAAAHRGQLRGRFPALAEPLGPGKSGGSPSRPSRSCRRVLALPVSALSGAFFILASAQDSGRSSGRRASAREVLTLANTASAARSAPWSGGFLLLPELGVERSLFAIAALYVLDRRGARPARTAPRERTRPAAAALAVVAARSCFPFGSMEGRQA